MTQIDLKKSSTLLREDGAERILNGVTDSVSENLMKLCFAEARMRFMKWKDLTDEKWQEGLPVAGFDMEFFASVLKAVFAKREVIERILSGDTIESATRWNEI